MKKTISIFITAFFVFAPFNLNANSCNSTHSCNGCTINFTQTETFWYYTAQCGTEPAQLFQGDEEYEGTFCEGQNPCTL